MSAQLTYQKDCQFIPQRAKFMRMFAMRKIRQVTTISAAWLLPTSLASAQDAAELTQTSPLLWTAIAITIASATIAIRLALKQRQMRNRLDETEALLKYSGTIIDHAPGSFITVHPNGSCYCSDAFQDWLGLTSKISSLADIEHAANDLSFSARSMQRLMEQISGTRDNGGAFINAYKFLENGELYLVSGARVQAAQEGAGRSYSVIWFCPLSAIGAQMGGEQNTYLDEQKVVSALLDQAPFPIWTRNAALRIDWANKAYRTIVEQEDLRVLLDSQLELAGDSHRDAQEALAREAADKNLAQNSKFYVITGGERRSLSVTEAPLDTKAGTTIGFATDITREEFMQAELEQHKSSHAETLDKLSTAVAIFGPDQKLQFYNMAFSSLWHLSGDWLDKEPLHGELLESLRDGRQLPEQADFPSWKKQILQQYTDLIEPDEQTWHLPNGKTLRVVTQPHPLGGLLVFFEDVTDRLALERSYNTLIEVQRETLENLYEAVAVVGGDGRIKLFNSSYAGLLNIAPDDLAAEPHLRDVLNACQNRFTRDPNAWPSLRDEILGFAISRSPHSGQWQLVDGTVAEFSVVPLPDGAALFSIIDQTAKANISTALEEKERALEAADRLKSEFVASMSYELRTPLNSIIGFSELMRSEIGGALSEQHKAYVDATLQSSNKLRELIDNILDLAIIEAGKMALDAEPFDVKETMERVLALVRETAATKSIQLNVSYGRVTGEAVGDERRIRQALYNLLLDSLIRTSTNGSIDVEVKSQANDKEQIIFSVRDSGRGHARSDNKTSPDETSIPLANTGSSLGLSLVKSFFELHGGGIDSDVQQGGGRLVLCRLPRKFSADAPKASADTHPAGERD